MEFKDILTKISELEIIEEAKKESTAKKDHKAEKAGKKVAKDIEYDEGHKGKDDNKAEKAGKKVTKDIEYDDKKDKKKKSLKDWFEQIDKNLLAEAEQITLTPAKQNTQVIKQGNKTLGTVNNPQLAAQIKQSIGKGEMSLAGTEMKEEAEDNPESAMMEKWAGDAEVKATGQYSGKSIEELKSMLAKLKKSGPHPAGSSGNKRMKQIMFAIRSKKGWKGGVDEGKAKNPYAIGMAQAMKATGDEPPLKKSTITKAHDIAKSVKKKTNEAERPSDQTDYGAGLGAGRSDTVLEAKPDFLDLDKDGNKKESMKKAAADKKKKKVDESMDKCKSAYHEGKAHGLSKHGYACRYDHGSPEHEHYHKGFKEGLDECYGLMPVQGLVVSETEPAATVPGMASQAMPAMEADMEEGNAFTAALAKTPKGGKFSVGGKTFTDTSNYSAKVDEYAFESLDKQLNDLLNESTTINEGISVNMQKGIGAMGDDSVSVTATADDAGKLLDFIKQVGLGGLGDEHGSEAGSDSSVPVVAVASDYGAPAFSGHDDMAGLISKVSGHDHDHEHEHPQKAEEGDLCSECGMMEASCGCEKEKVDEVETEDQAEFEVAEDSAGADEVAMTSADEDAEAAEDATKPASGGAVNEGGDGAEAGASDAANAVDVADEEEEEEAALSEWANNAGQKGTDQAFERDIEFMTKVISGGLNKPKSTGQQTIPVLAGDKARTGIDEELISEWKKLSGIR